MVNLTSLRTKIENKIFTNLGSTCTVASVSTSSIDKWGDGSVTAPTPVSVTFVPWNLINPRQAYESFGDLEEGEMDAAFKYSQTLDIGYKVVFSGKNYIISELEDFIILDGSLVKVARLRKELG